MKLFCSGDVVDAGAAGHRVEVVGRSGDVRFLRLRTFGYRASPVEVLVLWCFGAFARCCCAEIGAGIGCWVAARSRTLDLGGDVMADWTDELWISDGVKSSRWLSYGSRSEDDEMNFGWLVVSGVSRHDTWTMLTRTR